MLIVSEIAEAVEELRISQDHTVIRYHESGKPEGFAVECADALIRLGDAVGHGGGGDAWERAMRMRRAVPFVAPCLDIWASLRQATKALMLAEPTPWLMDEWALGWFTAEIEDACRIVGAPLEEALEVKMRYNHSRPHRHGGKLA
jgi:hypothetical protein